MNSKIVASVAIIGIAVFLSIIAVAMVLPTNEIFVSVGDSALDKCIKGTTVSALMYLQTQGGHDASSYANAEKELIALMESECKSMPKVHLELRAQEGLFDIPLDREIELIKMCLEAGGHWDMGCRFF